MIWSFTTVLWQIFKYNFQRSLAQCSVGSMEKYFFASQKAADWDAKPLSTVELIGFQKQEAIIVKEEAERTGALFFSIGLSHTEVPKRQSLKIEYPSYSNGYLKVETVWPSNDHTQLVRWERPAAVWRRMTWVSETSFCNVSRYCGEM